MGTSLSKREEKCQETFGQSAPPGSWIIRFLPPTTKKKFIKNDSNLPTFNWLCPNWITHQLFRKLMFMVVQLFLMGDTIAITKLMQKPLTAVELIDQCNTVFESAEKDIVELEKEILEDEHDDIFAFVHNGQLCYFALLVTSSFDPFDELRNALNCANLTGDHTASPSQDSQLRYKKRKRCSGSTQDLVLPCTSTSVDNGKRDHSVVSTNTSASKTQEQSFVVNNNQHCSYINDESKTSVPKAQKDSGALHDSQKKEDHHIRIKKRKLDAGSNYPIPPDAIRVLPSAPSLEVIESCRSHYDRCAGAQQNDDEKFSKEMDVDNHNRKILEKEISKQNKTDENIDDHGCNNTEDVISILGDSISKENKSSKTTNVNSQFSQDEASIKVDTKENSAGQSSKEEATFDNCSHENVKEEISVPKNESISTLSIASDNEWDCKNTKDDTDSTARPKPFIPPHALRIVPSTLSESIGSSSHPGCEDNVKEFGATKISEVNCKTNDRVIDFKNELTAENKRNEEEQYLGSTRPTSSVFTFPIHGVSRNIVDPCCSKYLNQNQQKRKDSEKDGKGSERKRTKSSEFSHSCTSPVLPIHGLSRRAFRSPSKSGNDPDEKEVKNDEKNNAIFCTPKTESYYQEDDNNLSDKQTKGKKGNDHDDEQADDSQRSKETTSDDEDSSSEIQWYDALE